MLGDIKPANEVATGIPGYTQHTSKAPLNETSFTVEPSMTPQHQHHPHQLMTGTGLESVTVDRTTSGIEYSRGGGSPLGNAQQVPIPAATTAPPNLDVLLTSSEVRAEPAGRVSSGSAPDGDPGLPPPTAATPDLSALMTPAKEGQFDAGRENSNLVGAATLAVPRNGGGGTSTPDPTPQGDAGVAAGEANAPVTVSAAVSEDLAYSHRGSVLQSYAITGSVLVAAGAPARLRVTDPQGHIANATANAAVAEENATAVSMPPTREYSCKAGAVQPAGAPPKFVPTLLYRCSPAVQVLPVRVTCRLRKAGNAVLVWAQVIANPQLSQPLSGVSVLVNLPFSPQNKEVRDFPFRSRLEKGNLQYTRHRGITYIYSKAWFIRLTILWSTIAVCSVQNQPLICSFAKNERLSGFEGGSTERTRCPWANPPPYPATFTCRDSHVTRKVVISTMQIDVLFSTLFRFPVNRATSSLSLKRRGRRTAECSSGCYHLK